MTKEEFLVAVGQQESGGDYNAVNGDSGAFGKYQIMPENWSSWAERVGLSPNSEQTPENQETVVKEILGGYFDKYGAEGALVAWYAGEQNGQRWASGEADAIGEGGHYSWDAPQKNAPSVRGYVQEALGKVEGGFDPNTNGFNVATNRDFDKMLGDYGYGKSEIPQQENLDTKPVEFMEEFGDKFMGQVDLWSASGAYSIAKANLLHTNTTYSTPYKVSEADVQFVTTALEGDETAQRFVLLNGRDGESIRYLTQKKLEERKRKERIASYETGWSTLGTVAGMVADPVNFIPIGTGVNALRILGRTAGTITNATKIARYARIGGTVATINTTDTGLRGVLHGNKVEQKEYAWSAGLGFVLGAVGSALGDVVMGFTSRQSDSLKIASRLDNAENDALKFASDQTPSNAIRNETRAFVAKFHDKEFVRDVGNADLNKFESNQRIFALSLEDAKAFGRSVGREIPDKAKAFDVPNEGYTILIKDNIKDIAKIDGILKHEFAVHEGLRTTIGEKRYNKLMAQVASEMDTEGSTFYKARQIAGTADPEEVLAYAVEHGLIKKNLMQSLTDGVRKGLSRGGITTKYTNADIAEFIQQSMRAEMERATGIHYNPDGSTAWAGLKYSQDNLINPDVLARFIDLESAVEKQAQGELAGRGYIGKMLGVPMQKIGKIMEAKGLFATPVGVGINSISKTYKNITGKIFSDPRGRGHKAVTITADRQKTAIEQRLNIHFTNYVNTRQKYIVRNIKEGVGRKANMEFDKQVLEAYNAKYAGNTANSSSDFASEILEGAEHIKKLREEQIAIGKNSAHMFGIRDKDNLIEKDWNPVDHELWRLSDMELVSKFIRCFDGEAQLDSSVKFLEDYYKAAAKRDVIAEKIKRGIEKENKKISEGSEKQSTEVTAKMIDDYLEDHIPFAARAMVGATMHKMEGGQLGSPRFLKHRVPIDTTTVMSLPSGRDFSFDNNLRNYDMDYILGRNINRFAGEIVMKNTFGSQKALDDSVANVKFELNRAADDGRIDRSRVEYEVKVLEDSLKELQGKRPDRDTMGRIGALCRILQNGSYYKNGANMTYAQLGEIGGVMAYAGARGLFYTFKPLRKLIENVTEGKTSASAIRDAEFFMFGENMERQIWSTNWDDRVLRDALTEKNLINKSLIGVSSTTKNLGKITSTINMLGHMTDSMTRGVRNATIGDSIRWAQGETFSKFRDPFSEAKLKAANVSPQLAETIKADLQKYVLMDTHGKPAEFRLNEWMKKSPNSYWKWRDMIQNQADRAIVSGTQISNRNILKDSNSFYRMVFQYKDYTLRAVNAQTMRVMTAKDFDDFLAIGLSMATNMSAYALKAGAVAATLTALGAPEKAKTYLAENCSPAQLGKIAALRSSILGAPFSIPNDFYEAATGSPTIRTTVDRTSKQPVKDVGDAVGNVISQLPAVSTGWDTAKGAYSAFSLATDNAASKRDFRNFLKSLPIPNLIPWIQGVNLTVDQSNYPEKRPKKTGGNE